jgi:predicted nucleotidyltransferase
MSTPKRLPEPPSELPVQRRARPAPVSGDGTPRTGRAVLALHSFMVRTERGALRPLWSALYRGVGRLAAAALLWRRPGGSAYLSGSLAAGNPVYGVSDIDVAVVLPPEHSGDSLRRAWSSLCRRFPLLDGIFYVSVYEEEELRKAAAASPGPVRDEMKLRARPGMSGPARDWRLIRGPDRRPSLPPPDADQRRVIAWLELQHWWRYAFGACLRRRGPRTTYLCVKLISEPIRILSWLRDGGRLMGSREALERALVEMPDEEEAVRRALALRRALVDVADAPLAETLPAFLRLSARIARRLAEDMERNGATAVRVAWDGGDELVLGARAQDPLRALLGGEPTLLPLVDRRALTGLSLPDEAFCVTDANPTDPAALAAAAVAGRAGPYPALRAPELMLLPTNIIIHRGVLRAVQCRASDPVTFALADGSPTAAFPDTPQWSARDAAMRGVAEHHARLAANDDRVPAGPAALGTLFAAARAAMFLESIDEGDPELPLTAAAVCARLGDVAAEAFGSYRDSRRDGREPPASTVSAFRAMVAALPAYAPPIR